MRKVKIVLILTLLIITMCFVSYSPAYAGFPDGWRITSWYDLNDYFNNYLHDGDTCTLTLYDEFAIVDELEIEASNCTITIDTAFDYGRGYTICANDCKERFLNIEGDNVTIIFDDVRIYGFNKKGDGACIYVDGEGCKIVGGSFWCSNASVDGGAICLNRDDAIIEDCAFVDCYAGDDGGGIYVCAGADDCVINNCVFEGCSCKNRGNAVCGDNDTEVNNCKSDTGSSYKLCKVNNSTGSIISNGSLCVVLIIAGIAIITVIVLIILKKKKNKQNSIN